MVIVIPGGMRWVNMGTSYARVYAHSRQEALIVRALVELVHTVDAAHGGGIAEYDLVRTDTDDGSVLFEQCLDGAALSEANDVGGEPEVGNGGIPGTGERSEGREE